MEVTTEILETFKTAIETIINEDLTNPIHHKSIGFDHGSKYIRVFTIDCRGGRSAYCFIESATGDIYRAAGWKAPAKGIRGNLFNADSGLSCCGKYSINSLRKGF